MTISGTGASPLRIAGRCRALRDASSLAAGIGATPRVGAAGVVVAVAVMAAEIRFLPWPFREFIRDSGPWLVPLAFVAWIAAVHLGRRLRLRAGERRRLRRGGAVWWRDRDWPTDVERRIANGMRGPSVPVALAVTAAWGICAFALSFASGMGGIHNTPRDLGWVPAPSWVVVATYALPLAWLLFVTAPRLGRGRLVVAWPSFPQFTGGRCAFHVGTSPGGATIDGARVFLRCIRVRSDSLLPLAAWNSHLVGVAEARLPRDAQIGPASHLRVQFDVSSRLPATDLHAADAVRWEVLVVGTVGGADYADCVVVPVYAAAV